MSRGFVAAPERGRALGVAHRRALRFGAAGREGRSGSELVMAAALETPMVPRRFRDVSHGNSGELCSSPKVAQQMLKSCPRSREPAQLRPFLAAFGPHSHRCLQTWASERPSLAKRWPIWANLRAIWAETDQTLANLDRCCSNLVCRSRPLRGRRHYKSEHIAPKRVESFSKLWRLNDLRNTRSFGRSVIFRACGLAQTSSDIVVLLGVARARWPMHA